MVESIARLETMRDMFLYAQQIYSWCLGRDFSLIYSNCPSQQFFTIFLKSASAVLLLKNILPGPGFRSS